ncbi:MAG: DUF2784 family protein [Bacteroidetes bacterium]|nr:MAG: DUF2784 family protein [Bacteroidota bacterium]
MMNWLHIIDWILFIFHFLFVLFNLTGWIWRATRKLHLVSILLTFGSWFILGIFYGWGYCPLTDWHWSVLNKMGKYGLPNSYVSYLIERTTGFSLPDMLVDFLTLLFALVALALSVRYNFFKKNKHTFVRKKIIDRTD